MTAQTATPTRPALGLSPLTAVVGGIGAVFLLISVFGISWISIPAVPVAHIPAMNLDYSGLHHLSSSGTVPTDWIQKNYFSWIGWVLIVTAIIAVGATALLGHRVLGILGAVLSALGVILGLFAAKGALTWSQFWHEIPDLRAGAYLLVVGFLLILVAALLPRHR